MALIAGLKFRSSAECGILVPLPGIDPASPAWQGRFLTTGPPEESHL